MISTHASIRERSNCPNQDIDPTRQKRRNFRNSSFVRGSKEDSMKTIHDTDTTCTVPANTPDELYK